MIALDSMDDIPSSIFQNDSESNQLSPFDELREGFLDYFDTLVEDCCQSIDVEFAKQLQQNKTHIDRQVLADLIRRIQNIKVLISKNYLVKLKAPLIFDKSNKHLITNNAWNDSELSDENFEIEKIIAHINLLAAKELSDLHCKVSGFDAATPKDEIENPIFPTFLVRSLAATITELNLSSVYRVALYKVFEENVFNQLGFIYKTLINGANPGEDILLEVVRNDAATDDRDRNKASNKPNDALNELQKKLERLRSDESSEYALLPQSHPQAYGVYDILSAINIIREFTDYENIDFKTEYKPIKHLVTEKLNEINSENNRKSLATEMEDVLDIVSILFQNIRNDTTLPEKLRCTLLKLDLTFAEISLHNVNFLISSESVGRKLLDNLYEAAQFLNLEDSLNYQIKGHVDNLVTTICNDSSCGIDTIDSLLTEFLESMEKAKSRSLIIEQRTLKLVKNKELLELSKIAVKNEINKCLHDIVLPERINDFIFNVWQDLLLITYIHKDEEPEQWDSTMETMKNLIRSVVPSAIESERREVLKILPALVKDLRSGLKRISYDKQSRSRFFKELAVHHVLLINNNAVNKSTKEKKTEDQVTDTIKKKSYDIESTDYKQVKSLTLNQWVSFNKDSVMCWGQLIWQSEDTEHYLFADKNGKKLFQLTFSELIKQFENNQAYIIPFAQLSFTELILNY